MDLNIIVYKSGCYDSNGTLLNKIKRAIDFGFTTIALNVNIGVNEISNIPSPLVISAMQNANMIDLTKITILSRITVKIEDVMQTHKLNQSENAKKYDLLAIEPMNDKILSYINNGHYECDIISFNFSDKLPYNIRRANFSLVISKGIGIELNFSDCLLNQSARRSILGFGQILVNKTRSKNILLSSGASTYITLRSPKDIACIGLMFGMNDNECKEAVHRNGLKVIKHAEIRKNVNIGTISIQQLDFKQNDKWLINELNKRTLNEQNNNSKRIKLIK